MADNTLSKLAQLISAGDSVDLREAALRVSGYIGSGQHQLLAQAVIQALDNAEPELRREALRAVGLLGIESALPHLEAFVRQGGEELEPAVQAAGQLGARGSRLMGRIMEEVAPSLRSRIAAVLARAGSGNALVVIAHALLDGDPKVVEAAARSLAGQVPQFTNAQRHSLARSLLESLQGKAKLPVPTEAAMIRVLGTLHDPAADVVFWPRLDSARPREIRVAALQALGNQTHPLTDKKQQRLLACAADPDFQIVAAALMLLKNVPLSAGKGSKNQKPWLELLRAPDVATRRFAIERLHGWETKELAQALVPQIDHPDRALREDALAVLCGFSAGGDALLEKLLTIENVEDCWSLSRAMAAKLAKLTAAQLGRLFDQACTYQDQDDRRAAALWFLLRELDAAGTRDKVEEKARALRQKKKYARALVYYRLLAHDPACSEDLRFELAATALKESSHDLALESRLTDPALHQFSRLLPNLAFDLIGKVTKAKWLDPADLFYLGFHFVEQNHRAKEFGKQVLELVNQRLPKSDLAKSAKRKLQSEGAQ